MQIEVCKKCYTHYPIWADECPICKKQEMELIGHIGYFE